MSLFTWLCKRTTGRPHARRVASPRPTPRFRPQLEALERRDVPSTLTVMNNLDSGAGSLRADIAAAQSGDTINLSNLKGTITLTSGELLIEKSLTIQGPGAGQLAISGGPTSAAYKWLPPTNTGSRVFDVAGFNTNVMLSGLTITQGSGRGYLSSGLGGGILNISGSTLTINSCTVSNNSANTGGGIANDVARLYIVNSTLSGNTVNTYLDGDGGGVYSVSGIVSMTGCTLSGNSASYEGGGVFSAGTQMTISGCTISGNTAGYAGGGIYNGGGPMTISGCTLSGNVSHNHESGGYGYFLSTGNEISAYGENSSYTLTVSDSVFSNNTPYRYSPILAAWIDGGGNTGTSRL